MVGSTGGAGMASPGAAPGGTGAASPTGGAAGCSTPSAGGTGFSISGLCGTVQAYSANKVNSKGITRCIANIRKSWNLHYM
jgi:hypothetical protein